MSAHFITGTGTDIGKTWLVCALLRCWREQGLDTVAYKPVQSGFDPLSPAASDAGALLAALGRTASPAMLDEIAPWRFAAPLSPDMAAALEGRSIPFADLVAFTRRQVEAGGARSVLIEGVGGVMVPLDERHTVRDWIAAAELPAVMVAGSYLGSLSHTLTAVIALQQSAVTLTAIAVNESPGSTVALAATIASLSRHLPDVPIIAISRATAHAGVHQLAALLR